MQVTSGTTAVATTSAAATEVIAASTVRASDGPGHHARVTNEGGVAGFVSFSGANAPANQWRRLPADQVVNTFLYVFPVVSVHIKRDDSDNMADVFAEVWG
jgi:hypothetical protein